MRDNTAAVILQRECVSGGGVALCAGEIRGEGPHLDSVAVSTSFPASRCDMMSEIAM